MCAKTTLLIFDPACGAARLFELPVWAQMPFVERFSLSVAAFFGCSHAGFAWTDRRALDALDALAALYEPLSVCRAFADALSSFPHAGGTAFDLCRGRSARERAAIRRTALATGRFWMADADVRSPDCVHVEALMPRALRPGDAGADVCRLQALLQRCGAHEAALSGTYCEGTRRAVLRAQQALGLGATGSASLYLQHRLQAEANSRGRFLALCSGDTAAERRGDLLRL